MPFRYLVEHCSIIYDPLLGARKHDIYRSEKHPRRHIYITKQPVDNSRYRHIKVFSESGFVTNNNAGANQYPLVVVSGTHGEVLGAATSALAMEGFLTPCPPHEGARFARPDRPTAQSPLN